MNQAKSLAMFGGFNWKLVYQAWNADEIDGSCLRVWTFMCLLVSVRTINLGRSESVRRWTWLWGVLMLVANAWQDTEVSPGGLYQGDPVFPRDMIHKLLQNPALRVNEAELNKEMHVEAYDTRRIEHMFGTIKPIAGTRLSCLRCASKQRVTSFQAKARPVN
jgi:hypothetical protein